MLSRIQSLGSGLIVLTLLLFAGSAGAQDVSPSCQAAMDRAAGDYSRCLLRADAHNARHGNATKLANRQLRCQARFDRRATRAIKRQGANACASANLMAAMADRTATCAQGIATEAGGKTATWRLYVQNADGGSLTESTLTLTGVSPQTGWFASRPYRDAGRMSTADFVALFSEEGAGSFGADPPNADLACESNGESVNQAVTLMDPVPDEATGTLSYTVTLLASEGGTLADITCDSEAYLFIDSKEAADTDCTPLPSYNCFVAGFCAQGAAIYPPAEYNYTNSYAGQTKDTGPALAAGCTMSPKVGQWPNGAQVLSMTDKTDQLMELRMLCDSTTTTTSACAQTSDYNCVVAGFCSQAATIYTAADGFGANLYAGHTMDKGAALAAGCGRMPGSGRWLIGEKLFSNVMPDAQGPELAMVCYGAP